MEIVKTFAIYLVEQGKVDKINESYTGDIRGYFNYLAVNDNPFKGKLNCFAINSYKNYLIEPIMN